MQSALASRGRLPTRRPPSTIFWRWTRALEAAATTSAAIAWVALGLVLHAADNLLLTERSRLNDLADLHA